MKWMNNVSVRGKLMIMTIPLAVALIAAVLIAAIGIGSTEKNLTDVYFDKLYQVNSNLVSADRDFYQAMIAATQMHEIGSDGEAYYKDGLIDEFETNRQQVIDKVAAARDIARTNDELYSGIKSETGYTFESAYSNYEKNFKIWDGDYDINTFTGDWDAYNLSFLDAREALNDMQEITEAWAEEEHKELAKQNRSTIIVFSSFFGALIVVLVFFVIAVIRAIRLGIADITEKMEQLASGNLTLQFIPESDMGKDDIGKMQRSCLSLTNRLRDVMGKSNAAADNLRNAGVDLADSASQASQASEQVTDAVTEISKGAVSQAESVERAVTDTDEIGKNIENITGDVKEMDRFAAEMKESCDKAMDALDKLIRQSEDVTRSVKEIGATITSTNESAKTISQFTQAITDIATQTNLLSLNASIEAARAGDAGRGFAVVADEIRQLADQSSDSADKIKTIVETLLADAESSVNVLEKLNESFGVQAVQLDSTKKDMVSMSGNVESVKTTSTHISSRIGMLQEAKNGLMEIISDLSAISEENAASTEETNASMEELNATFTIISESASKLQGLSTELSNTIHYFRL